MRKKVEMEYVSSQDRASLVKTFIQTNMLERIIRNKNEEKDATCPVQQTRRLFLTNDAI